MSRPVYILNKNKKVQFIGEPENYTTMFGDDYHFVNKSSNFFTITSLSTGGILFFKDIPIGVVAVDQTYTLDNSIRVIALKNMDCLHPKIGTLQYTTSARNYQAHMSAGFNMKTYGGSASMFIFTGPYDTSKSFTKGSTFTDGWHDHKVLIDATDYFVSVRTQQGGSYINMSGWRTMTTIPDHVGSQGSGESLRHHSAAACCAWHFDPTLDGSTAGYWYVPSLHELIITYQEKNTINASFAQIKNTYGNDYKETIPYAGSNTGGNAYWASAHSHTDNPNWGNANMKFDVYSGTNRKTKFASGSDGGVCIPFLKLLVSGIKVSLDPSYHID